MSRQPAGLPRPPIPAHVDVRDLDGFMLNTERLMASELMALSSGAEFKAAVALWCRAWKQLPAGSLPNDERVLAAFSGAGDNWDAVKDMALRGFILCSDGRLYHPTLCGDAVKAFAKKTVYLEHRGADAERKARERAERQYLFRQIKERGVHLAWNTSTKDLRNRATELGIPPEPPTPKRDRSARHDSVRVTGIKQKQALNTTKKAPVTPVTANTGTVTVTKEVSVYRGGSGGSADTPPPEHTQSDEGFRQWARACRRTIPKGWKQDLALRRWLILPAHPVKIWIDAWDCYIEHNRQQSEKAKYPQRTSYPENWWKSGGYRDFLEEAITKHQRLNHTNAKRLAALQRFHPHGPAIIAKIGEPKFDAWLLDAEFIPTAPAQADLRVPTPFQQKWLRDHPEIVRAIETVTSTSITVTGPSLPATAAAG